MERWTSEPVSVNVKSRTVATPVMKVVITATLSGTHSVTDPEGVPTPGGDNLLLPSATKLRRLCFYTCVSVHRGGLPQCMLGYHHPSPPPPEAGTSPEQTPPRSRHPREQTPPLPGSRPPRAVSPPGSKHPPRSRQPPLADGYCCGRYASYWNAFLFGKMFAEKCMK